MKKKNIYRGSISISHEKFYQRINMLKFIRGKAQQPSLERQKLQRELFAYRKTTQHGFPHKPCALAFEPQIKLMAIGTSSGCIEN